MNTVTPPASLPEIASAVRALLEAGVGPAEGRPSGFEQRVAARLMAVLQRELEQGGDERPAEREALCERIAQGPIDPPLLDQLWDSALARLGIDNPGYRWR